MAGWGSWALMYVGGQKRKSAASMRRRPFAGLMYDTGERGRVGMIVGASSPEPESSGAEPRNQAKGEAEEKEGGEGGEGGEVAPS